MCQLYNDLAIYNIKKNASLEKVDSAKNENMDPEIITYIKREMQKKILTSAKI